MEVAPCILMLTKESTTARASMSGNVCHSDVRDHRGIPPLPCAPQLQNEQGFSVCAGLSCLQAGIAASEVDCVLIQQANLRIIEYLQERTGIAADKCAREYRLDWQHGGGIGVDCASRIAEDSHACPRRADPARRIRRGAYMVRRGARMGRARLQRALVGYGRVYGRDPYRAGLSIPIPENAGGFEPSGEWLDRLAFSRASRRASNRSRQNIR